MILWDEGKFLLQNSFANQHWIYSNLLDLESNPQVTIFNLYVSVSQVEKYECWLSLTYFIEAYNHQNIIVPGDLNITLVAHEKKRGVFSKDPSRVMVEDIIWDWDLMDVKPKAGC